MPWCYYIIYIRVHYELTMQRNSHLIWNNETNGWNSSRQIHDDWCKDLIRFEDIRICKSLVEFQIEELVDWIEEELKTRIKPIKLQDQQWWTQTMSTKIQVQKLKIVNIGKTENRRLKCHQRGAQPQRQR